MSADAALPDFKRRATQDLMTATLAGDVQGITQAVAMGANMNATDDSGRTPLATAAARDDLEALNKLLQLGAKASTRCSNGHTALYAAAAAPGAESTAKRLLLWDDTGSKELAAAAEMAVQRDKLDLCAHILKKLSQVDERRCNAVLQTLWAQNPAQAQSLNEAILAAWTSDIEGQGQQDAELEAQRKTVESQQQGLESLLFAIAREASAAAAAAPAGKRCQR